MDPELVKVAVEIGKATGAATGLSIPFTGIVKRMLGPAADEVAEMWRDQIRLYRYGRQLKLLEKAEKMAQNAGFTPQAVPPKILFPLLEGASFEDNEDLHTMWASLLANAASVHGEELVAPSFISILREMARNEAILLNWFHDVSTSKPFKRISAFDEGEMRIALGLPSHEEPVLEKDRRIERDLDGLEAANLIRRSFSVSHFQTPRRPAKGPSQIDTTFAITERGSAFMLACRPPQPK